MTISVEALHAFVKWAVTEGAFEGTDLDGGDVFEKAKELGLLVAEPYDPAKHGDSWMDIEPGGDWYRIRPLEDFA